MEQTINQCDDLFLSTPSARRATLLPFTILKPVNYFYPRPPRGGRRIEPVKHKCTHLISIHALREEGDLTLFLRMVTVALFLSTPSARRATGVLSYGPSLDKFLSTPSARRATLPPVSFSYQQCYFYPRPPRGGRQQKQRQNLYFQTNYTTFCTNLEEP